MSTSPDTAPESAVPATSLGGESGRTFSEIASQLGVLTPENSLTVAEAARQAGVEPVDFALMKTMIQPVDADIIRTLMDPGQAIPGYQIVSLLGRGGMGIVYRARQHSLDRFVALKTVLLSRLSTPTFAQRFEQEARSLARLAHPHIIAIYDFGRHNERLYFAMELIEGEDVDRLVRRTGALQESLAWHLIRQAASGLAHAAKAGIVHRDIKPANLMLVTPPEGFLLPPGVPLVKIADFGLALLSSPDATETRLTSENVHVGSPLYMAPEQIQSGTVDHRADIFSLGITAWQMLAGQPPLHGKALSQVLTQRITVTTEPVTNQNPRVSAASADLVAAMLHRDPAQRIGDYAKLLAAIDRLLATLDGSLDSAETRIEPRRADQPELRDSVVGGMTVIAATIAGEVHAEPAEQASAEAPARKSKGVFTRRNLLLAGIAGLLVIGGIGWRLRPKPKLVRELVGDGQPVSIFNGETLAGWKTVGGGWLPGKDAEGASVMVGTNGKIAYAATTWTRADYRGRETAPIPAHLRFDCHVDYSAAKAVELECDFGSTDAFRLVVRLGENQITIGERESENGELVKTYPVARTIDVNRTSADVRIERQPRQFWIEIDGDLAAVVPAARASSLRELRLKVEKGTAKFSDLVLEALVIP